MSIDADKAFEIEAPGLLIRDAVGAPTVYLTSESGVPVGSAPINTYYFNKDNQRIYYKFGNADTDWIEYRGYVYGNQNPNFQTISPAFQPALEVKILNAPTGDYRMGWSYRSNNSKSNTDNNTEARFNTLAVVTNTSNGQSSLGGGLGEQFSGFYKFSILNQDLTVSLNLRRIAGNGLARINTMNLEVERVG